MKKGWMIIGMIIFSSILLIMRVSEVAARSTLPLSQSIIAQQNDRKPSYDYQALDTLTVYVQNANGQPSAGAYVYAYTTAGVYAGFGKTGSDGYTSLTLDAGTYNITAESYYDNFYLKRSGVAVPGSITISTDGASRVTLTARSITNTPLNSSSVGLNEVGNEDHFIFFGQTDTNGVLIFYVAPGFYNIAMTNSLNRYALYKINQDFTNPTSAVDFNMSYQHYATISVHHPYDETSSLELNMVDGKLGYWNIHTWDGDNVVISDELNYGLSQNFYQTDADKLQWGYYFSSAQDVNLAPYQTIEFTAGGPIHASGRTDDTSVGETIDLATVVDSFGNDLTNVYTWAPGQFLGTPVLPSVKLVDPNRTTTSQSEFSYTIPLTATLGTYGAYLEWDTGPYQGQVSANSQFMVLPKPVSAVITPEGGSLYSAWDDTLYEFPAGTFDADVVVTHTVIHSGVPAFLPMAGTSHFYRVEAAYVSDGSPAQPSLPYTITIGYRDDQKFGAIDSTLGLYNWKDSEWVLEPTSTVDLVNKQITATPNSFSTWGILGETSRVFMAAIRK